MSMQRLLGLPLQEALERLRAQGMEPAVIISKAPRRPDEVGAFRVVRVRSGGREITACAFLEGLEKETR